MQIKVVDPPRIPGNLTYSPLQVSRIEPAANGIELQHREAGPVEFGQLRLLSVFGVESGGVTPYHLLLFLHGHRRPFVATANVIHYHDFPLERADTLLPQLRSFARYLLQQNPNLAVDRRTLAFLNGKMPHQLARDMVATSTALAQVLEQVDEVDGAAST